MNDVVETQAPHVRDAYTKVRRGQYVFYGSSSSYDEIIRTDDVRMIELWADVIIDTKQNKLVKCRVEMERTIDKVLGIPRNGQ